jgi:hypothetical protein
MQVVFENKNRLGSKYWINSEDKDFRTLVKESKMIPEFFDSRFLKNMGYENRLLVPVNPYVEYFYPKPNLIKTDTGILLRQKTHAEIWVEYQGDFLYMLDKCWQRQFYPSKNSYNNLDDKKLYRFYVPWTIEHQEPFEIRSISESFNIHTGSISFYKRDFNETFIETPFIDFTLKRNGPHVKADNYGIVSIGTPMYDIVINHGDLAEKVIKEYEQGI